MTLNCVKFTVVFPLVASIVFSGAFVSAAELQPDNRPGIAPDIREDESVLKVQRGDFVVVPIPISNPTLDTGLVVAGAYFYAQTEEQKRVQPASLTAAAGFYSSNDSRAFALVQQNYWKKDRWRFTGAAGAADLRLKILAPDGSSSGESLDWQIKGQFLFAKLSTRIKGDWYGGGFLRVIDADQGIALGSSSPDFDTAGEITSVGLGVNFEYDSRDMPLNTFNGHYAKIGGLFNDEAMGSDKTYQSYSIAYRYYRELNDELVLALDTQGCARKGSAPLWDACTIKLRGFSATDYLGRTTASAQLEARWRMSKRWGMVGFAGAGYVGSSFSGLRDNEPIPSYGIGVRFSVLPAKRINLRVDFARSKDSDAVHVSVGEAF
jgi:hypothetical protein